MIADLLANHIGSFNLGFTGIRPISAGITDDFPYCTYQSSGLRQIDTLNTCTGWYEGKIRLEIFTRDRGNGDVQGWAEINTLTEAVKMAVPGTTASDGNYAITRIKYDDESDIDGGKTDSDTPYYVRSIDLWVRAKRIEVQVTIPPGIPVPPPT